MIPGWEQRLRRHLADIACGKGVPRRRMYGRTDSQFVHRLNYQSEFQIDARTGYFLEFLRFQLSFPSSIPT